VTSSSTATTGHSTTLPNTGYDLLPETLIGFALVGVGVGLKLRRSRA
jgi:LPXTG-motif cell wall-anchored protein